MKMKNNLTGDVVEVPPPDNRGNSVVLFNGRIVERVTYSDLPEDSAVTTEGGKVFSTGDEWATYLVEKLRTGAWKVVQ